MHNFFAMSRNVSDTQLWLTDWHASASSFETLQREFMSKVKIVDNEIMEISTFNSRL